MNDIARIPDQLTTQDVATILPGAVDQSVIPGFKCRRGAPANRVLFIGGVLDGRMVDVPPDGRHYYHHTDPDGFDGETFIYIPAVIRFKDKVTAVYLLEERILPATTRTGEAICVESRLGIRNEERERIAAQRRLA